MMNIIELISKQLNDYEDSPSGVDQGAYFRWKKHHIEDAVVVASSYLYGLLPNQFSKKVSFKTRCEGCVVTIPLSCSKPLSIIGVGSDCDNVTENSTEENSLLSLLSGNCNDDVHINDSYEYKFISSHEIQFSSTIEKGTEIFLMCAKPPESFSEITGNIINEHSSLLVNFALWFLFLSDSESRSNLQRVLHHYTFVGDYVRTKLLIDFSLREDDYSFGRRKVDDN